jgi:hypothetical protein
MWVDHSDLKQDKFIKKNWLNVMGMSLLLAA